MKLLKRGFIVELKHNVLRNVPVLKAEGEEQPTNVPSNTPDETGNDDAPSQPAPTINYEDLISRARKEEKDKLYPEIKKLKGEKETLVKKNNDLLIENGELKIEVENLKKQLASAGTPLESDALKAKDATIKDLREKVTELENNTVDRSVVEKEIEGRLRAEYEVKEYRLEAINRAKELGEGVIPELVIGGTKEEVDASLEISKNRFKELFSSVVKGAQSLPVSSPSTSQFLDKGITLDELTKLDPRSKEYKELRTKLGLK